MILLGVVAGILAVCLGLAAIILAVVGLDERRRHGSRS